MYLTFLIRFLPIGVVIRLWRFWLSVATRISFPFDLGLALLIVKLPECGLLFAIDSGGVTVGLDTGC